MKALSIRQPWAYAILHLGKDIENRSWKTNFRGDLLIHAGKSYDKNGEEWLKSKGFEIPENLPCGGFVGMVEVTGCEEESDSIWWMGQNAWSLENPREIPFTEFKGKLGLFNVEPGVVDESF